MSSLSRIGKLTKELRKSRGLGQQDLALLAGVSQTRISYVETGKKIPGIKFIGNIAGAFGMTEGMFMLLCLDPNDFSKTKKGRTVKGKLLKQRLLFFQELLKEAS